jgi:hypothetical protein
MPWVFFLIVFNRKDKEWNTCMVLMHVIVNVYCIFTSIITQFPHPFCRVPDLWKQPCWCHITLSVSKHVHLYQ